MKRGEVPSQACGVVSLARGGAVQQQPRPLVWRLEDYTLEHYRRKTDFSSSERRLRRARLRVARSAATTGACPWPDSLRSQRLWGLGDWPEGGVRRW